ncbi:DUF3068 domain-containing protein [Corynebacterium aquatimens]|uniref:DUF3068 domain-containing protein n=1 Tax=Corynebacterium aquatimens TaxID=1190508 RepID=A0A931E248_9CORY|nr:DUF3068 domain-containing protein [Corynebacterium aquatimens]MBG6122406.1 hypothetical protein [Corynebacterium aquatimens]WJY65054.1 hypothetical protein CAQUA_01595 [Corynebacterium aquatimens]
MLPKSRVISALLVGLGLALLLAGIAAPRFLNGDARFPLDLEHTTWTVHDPDATVDGKPASVTHQLHMTVQNPSTDKVAGLRIGDSLLRGPAGLTGGNGSGSDIDNLIAARTWALEMDRHTGQFVSPVKVANTMAMPETQIPVEGVWLKFPVHVEKTTYNVFDPTLRTTAPATFTGEKEIAGRTAYSFVQEIAPTNVATLFNDPANITMVEVAPGTLEQAYLTHAARREFMVDQSTGLVVGMSELIDDYYADRTGRGLRNIATYEATMDDAQVEALASQLPRVTAYDSRIVTIAVLVTGGLLTLAGLVGALRPQCRSPQRRLPQHERTD